MALQQIIFYLFASLVVGSGALMIFSRNPVKSALFLVLAFFASAAVWMMLEAEFLALILIFVYVGAVMTLFLFVVMMLHLEPAQLKGGFVKYLPFALIVLAILIGVMVYVFLPVNISENSVIEHSAEYSNIKALGSVLYTEYVYPTELAAVLLLVAIVAAISLAHKRRSKHVKGQDVSRQLAATKANRLRVMKVATEPKVKDE